MEDAMAALLTPSTNVVATVEQVVKVQLAVQSEIDALNHKLAIATAHQQSPSRPTAGGGAGPGPVSSQKESSSVQVERYITRLRQCRTRVEATAKTLAVIKKRLVRVYANLAAKTRAVEKSNTATQESISKSLAPEGKKTAAAAGGDAEDSTSACEGEEKEKESEAKEEETEAKEQEASKTEE